MRTALLWAFAGVSLLSFGVVDSAFGQDKGPIFDLPRIRGVVIDGDASEWGRFGFQGHFLADAKDQTRPKASLDAGFRLGWDERGLLALVTVRDDAFVEQADATQLRTKDSVELFVADRPGGRERFALTFSPGMTSAFSSLRTQVTDARKAEKRAELTYEAARAPLGGPNSGYTLEVRIPWTDLGITPAGGREIALQLGVNDADGEEGLFRAVWCPKEGAPENAEAMYRVRLARKASAPDCVRVRGEFDDVARVRVQVLALGDLVGQKISVKEGGRTRAEGPLVASGDYARAELRFPMPAWGEAAEPWHVRVGSSARTPFPLPDVDRVRAQRVMLLTMAAKPPVFKGATFPSCDFENPLLAEALLGHYRIETTFYDRNYARVESAKSPGRYGAVLDIKPDSGPSYRRFLTLFRAPDNFDSLFAWWVLDPKMTIRLPESLGIDRAVVEAQRESFDAYFKGQVLDDLYRGQEAAALFAGLYEAAPGLAAVSVTDDVWAVDRQWWVGLKRQLNGMAQAYPGEFVCPYAKEGTPAPELRVGTPQEAGMKADTADKVDAVCRAWAEESGEPFAVCLARHGVAFFHKAYGQRDGEAITTETKSWMASISKFLSGALMMELVSQGLTDLDKPVDAYLPALRGIPVQHPLTIRHLYTHTSGLGMGLQPPRMFIDHWGDQCNDFDEIVAGYYPYLEVGARLAYNGAGHALGGKIIESISGEALPQFFKRHLWGPLGCEHTDAMDGAARTMSAPMDIARFGQMILNHGAYGSMRFFSEEAFQRMLPTRLAPYVQYETETEWGIGPVWMPMPGLSKRTIGHGAASSAMFAIDLDHELIVVMTRNTGGKEFGKYHGQFIQAIADGME